MFSYSQLVNFRRGDETPPPPWCVDVQDDDLYVGNDSGNVSNLPVFGLYNYTFSAQIYKQSEIGVTKQLTAFSMRFSGYTSGYTYLNQKLFLAHIEESQFTAGTTVGMPNMTIKDKILVKEFNFTPVNNQQNVFNFDTNFCYNGEDNLLLIWENRDGSWQSGYGNSRRTILTGELPTLYSFTDDAFPSESTVGTTTNVRNDITLIF